MRRLLDFVASGSLLSSAQAEEIMQELLDGQLQTPEIVQFLRALNARPFRAEELVGFARAMRRCATPVFREGEILPERMVDTCGTGGDDSGTFNISTAAAIVASAAGARVRIGGVCTSDAPVCYAGIQRRRNFAGTDGGHVRNRQNFAFSERSEEHTSELQSHSFI